MKSVGSGKSDVDAGQKLVDGRQSNVTEQRTHVNNGRRQASPAKLIVPMSVTVSDTVTWFAMVAMTVTSAAFSMAMTLPSVFAMLFVVTMLRWSPQTGGYNRRSDLRESPGSYSCNGGSGPYGRLRAETINREDSASRESYGQCGLKWDK